MAKMTERLGAASPRRLSETIERLEAALRMGGDLVRLKEKQLAQNSARRLEKLRRRLAPALLSLEERLMGAEEAAQALLDKRLPALAAKQRLAFRKLRQDLRRAEGLLDRQGRMKPGAALSAQAEGRLDALLKSQQAERDALNERLLKEARDSRPAPGAIQEARAAYEKARADTDRRMDELKSTLAQKDAAALAAYRNKQERKAESLRRALAKKQAALAAVGPGARDALAPGVTLRLDGLSMALGGLRAVDNLSFDVKKGEIFGLIGPNGAGKTTVFNCITQFYKPTGGDILYRTREGGVLALNHYQVHDVITKGIVRTFQNVEVVGELSILENLLVAAHRQYHSGLFRQMFNTRRVREEEQVIRARALEVLQYCGLSALRDLPPVGQPYGVLKRIELARTLMAGANLIILDEPAAGLNDQETVELTHLIRKIQKDFDATIFLVEHNMGLVMGLCDHICAISFGKKLAYGTPEEIQNDPAVQEAYLGTSDKRELEAV